MSNASQETKVLSPNQVDTLAMWDAKIAETEQFLRQNPDVRLTAGARDILAEYQEKRATALFNFEHPPLPPPPAPTPELIKQITEAVLALMPEFVARVVVELQKK